VADSFQVLVLGAYTSWVLRTLEGFVVLCGVVVFVAFCGVVVLVKITWEPPIVAVFSSSL
jgi:hypothetical protein